MAWVAVDRSGDEAVYKNLPRRTLGMWSDTDDGEPCSEIDLPKGTIKKLIGRDLNWSNEPVELKEA